MAEAINPVTLRGIPNNISLGRIWLGTDTLQDGANRLNPQDLHGTWEKTMQFVVWRDPSTPLGFMCISDEEEFIKKTHELLAGKSDKAELVGGSFRGKEIDRVLKIMLVDSNIYFRIEKTNETNTLMGSTFIPKQIFLQGMEHLFPKGEYEIPD